MEQLEPRFLKEGYGIYTNEGLKIKDDVFQWAIDEYKKFMSMKGYNEICVKTSN